MRKDLSSQIKLDRIPKRYYNPDSEIEAAALRREEKLNTRVFENVKDGATFLASEMVRYIKRYVGMKGKCVLALGSGLSTHPVYSELIKMYKEGKVNFSNVVIFNISEFFPLNPGGPSTMKRMEDVFLNHIDIKPENVRTINPAITKDTMYDYCQEYEKAIADEGGIDVALCEIAPNAARLRAIVDLYFSATRPVIVSARNSNATMCLQRQSLSVSQILYRHAVSLLWPGARIVQKLYSAPQRSLRLPLCLHRCCRGIRMLRLSRTLPEPKTSHAYPSRGK